MALMGGIGRLAAAPLVGSYRVASGAVKGAVATTLAQPMNQVTEAMGPGAMGVASQSMNYLTGGKSSNESADIVQSNKDASSKPEVKQSNKILGTVLQALEGIRVAVGEVEKSTRMTAMATHEMVNMMKKGPKDPYQKARERLQSNPILKPMMPFKADDGTDDDSGGKKKKRGGIFGGIMDFFGNMASGIGGIASWMKENWKLVLSVMGLAAIGTLLVGAFKEEIRDYLEKKGIIKEDETIFGGVASFVNEYIKKKLDDSPFFSWMVTEGTDAEGKKTREWSMGALMAGLAGLALFVSPFAGLAVAGFKLAAWGALIGGIVLGMIKLREFLLEKMDDLGIEDDDAKNILNDATIVGSVVGATNYAQGKLRSGPTTPSKPNTNQFQNQKPANQTRTSTILDSKGKPMQYDEPKSQRGRFAKLQRLFPKVGTLVKGLSFAGPKWGGLVAAALTAPEVFSVLTDPQASTEDKTIKVTEALGGISGVAALMKIAKLPKVGPWTASPWGAVYTAAISGLGYVAGASSLRALAEWVMSPGSPDAPKGEHGYPVDLPMIRKREFGIGKQIRYVDAPNPDYDPNYLSKKGTMSPQEIDALNLSNVEDVITTPGGAIDNQALENAAMTVINNSTITNNTAASSVDQSSSGGGGNGGGNGASSQTNKWNQLFGANVYGL